VLLGCLLGRDGSSVRKMHKADQGLEVIGQGGRCREARVGSAVGRKKRKILREHPIRLVDDGPWWYNIEPEL
jgi:hypothetical protein